MKKVFLVVALVLIIALPVSAASYMKTNGIGVGLSGGWPVSGVAVKYGMDDFRLVGTLGYNYNGGFALEAGAQYDLSEFDIDGIPFYVNVGVLVVLILPSRSMYPSACPTSSRISRSRSS
jgi:hypothetical protein